MPWLHNNEWPWCRIECGERVRVGVSTGHIVDAKDAIFDVILIPWWTAVVTPTQRRTCRQRRKHPQEHGSLSLLPEGFEPRGESC